MLDKLLKARDLPGVAVEGDKVLEFPELPWSGDVEDGIIVGERGRRGAEEPDACLENDKFVDRPTLQTDDVVMSVSQSLGDRTIAFQRAGGALVSVPVFVEMSAEVLPFKNMPMVEEVSCRAASVEEAGSDREV